MIWINSKYRVWLEVFVFPVHILEMLGRDDGELQVQTLLWWRARGGHDTMC